MKLRKKQIELIELIENCGYLFRDEIDNSQYPESMIESLIKKGVICEYKNKVTSATAQHRRMI